MATRRTCATCAHNGCCVDVHHCGGSCWEPEIEEEDIEEQYPYDGPDPYDQWLHDTEVYQESMGRRY